MGDLYRADMGLMEIIALLFYRKKCPNCKSKLRHINNMMFKKRGSTVINSVNHYGDIYSVKFSYRCDKYDKEIQLLDLTKSK